MQKETNGKKGGSDGQRSPANSEEREESGVLTPIAPEYRFSRGNYQTQRFSLREEYSKAERCCSRH
jgi:hypothetical protein